MSKRKIILVFNLYYLPGYRAGGPIKTIENMVDRLSDEFDFRIVTLDHDAGEKNPYPGLLPSEWYSVGRATVMYMGKKTVSIGTLVDIVGDVRPDAIYLNSFFDSVFTLRLLIGRLSGRLSQTNIIIAPRGEFSPGALQLKKFKKSLYIKITNSIGLYRQLVWQASSLLEKDQILEKLSWLRESDVREARNLAPDSVQQFDFSAVDQGGPLKVCFLSRIAPMKNLDFALRVLAEVSVPVVFTIYGPPEVASYWRTCEQLIAVLPNHIKVVVCGALAPTLVSETLSKHQLFFLPTLGENYGHVIFEALSAGLPVLISDMTPWKDIREYQVGWGLPLDCRAEYVDIIEQVSRWSQSDHEGAASRAIAYARRRADDAVVLRNNRELLNFAAQGLCER